MFRLPPDLITRAGIEPSELMDDPTLGQLMAPSAVLKLTALCADTAPVLELRALAVEVLRSHGKKP
jgi:hypothetical protein